VQYLRHSLLFVAGEWVYTLEHSYPRRWVETCYFIIYCSKRM